MPKPRLPLRRIALCIVLGALTSWLVACLAAASDWAGWPRLRPTTHTREFAYDQQLLVERVRSVSTAMTFDAWTVSLYDTQTKDGVQNLKRLRDLVPSHLRSSLPTPQRDELWDGIHMGTVFIGPAPTLRESLMADYHKAPLVRRNKAGATDTHTLQSSFGWPARSLAYMRVRQGANTSEVQYGSLVVRAFTRPIARGAPLHPTFPFLPLFPGLLLNTAFYAALWSLPLFALPLLKQRRRQRRGHCPRCNYNLNHALANGCPECGWNRSASVPNN